VGVAAGETVGVTTALGLRPSPRTLAGKPKTPAPSTKPKNKEQRTKQRPVEIDDLGLVRAGAAPARSQTTAVPAADHDPEPAPLAQAAEAKRRGQPPALSSLILKAWYFPSSRSRLQGDVEVITRRTADGFRLPGRSSDEILTNFRALYLSTSQSIFSVFACAEVSLSEPPPRT
jgi:hypothetical protein